MTMSGAETSPAATVLTPHELCSDIPVVHRADTVVRLYHIDSRFRAKARGMFEVLNPIIVDATRKHTHIDTLFARGIWAVIAHYDLELAAEPIAPGHVSEVTVGMCLGRTTDQKVFVAHEGLVYAHQGSGQVSSLQGKAQDAPMLIAGRLRSMVSLIQPFKPRAEFVVREIPEELSSLPVRRCAPVPSADDLLKLDAGFERVGTTLEVPSLWGMQHSDATQRVFNAEYVYAAEDHCTRLVQAAGLSVGDFKLSRIRVLFKRPFMPGQGYALSGSLSMRKSDKAAVALLGFYASDASGKPQGDAAVTVRIEARF